MKLLQRKPAPNKIPRAIPKRKASPPLPLPEHNPTARVKMRAVIDNGKAPIIPVASKGTKFAWNALIVSSRDYVKSFSHLGFHPGKVRFHRLYSMSFLTLMPGFMAKV